MEHNNATWQKTALNMTVLAFPLSPFFPLQKPSYKHVSFAYRGPPWPNICMWKVFYGKKKKEKRKKSTNLTFHWQFKYITVSTYLQHNIFPRQTRQSLFLYRCCIQKSCDRMLGSTVFSCTDGWGFFLFYHPIHMLFKSTFRHKFSSKYSLHFLLHTSR